MFAAAGLRALLVYQDTILFDQVILLLAGWAVVFACAAILPGRLYKLQFLLIGLEILLILVLLSLTRSDFFSFLLAIPCMQCCRQFDLKAAALLTGLTSLATLAILIEPYGAFQALALTLVYSAGTIFLVTYVQSTRRLGSAEERQLTLASSLQQANQRLAFSSGQVRQLSAARERQRLGRELHDSVTQTIFSMTLTTQSARLLLGKDLQQVAVQLERLDQLSQSALNEMQVLINGLAPEKQAGSRLIPALQVHVDNRLKLDNLAVRLVVESDGQLKSTEEEGLFRIAQESLNNIVKHARVSEAFLRIHLASPAWIEIEDHGAGFNRDEVSSASQFGLSGMEERAAEIGWNLKVQSMPGSGTLIRLDKRAEGVGTK